VSGDNFEAKRWGIGLGFACGILLAAMTLSEMPFFGRPRSEPRPQNLPRPQSREAQANIDPFAEVVAVKPPVSKPLPVAKSAVRPVPNSKAPIAAPLVAPKPIRTAQRLPDVDHRSPAVLAPIVPPPRDLDDDPREQMKFAQFLIKAHLAPIAAGPLRKVVKEAPDTSIAREAQHTLDTISRN
jgi:hypothetical protein